MNNLFLPTYKQLEKEFIDLSYYIAITDDNLACYSLKIADLILRCGLEIENIAKDIFELIYERSADETWKSDRENYLLISLDDDLLKLYRLIQKNSKLRKKFQNDILSFPKIKWLFEKINIYDKVVLFDFAPAKITGNGIKPFTDMGNGKFLWQESYNRAKHDKKSVLQRTSDLKLLESLISSMSGLYMLNIIYKFLSYENFPGVIPTVKTDETGNTVPDNSKGLLLFTSLLKLTLNSGSKIDSGSNIYFYPIVEFENSSMFKDLKSDLFKIFYYLKTGTTDNYAFRPHKIFKEFEASNCIFLIHHDNTNVKGDELTKLLEGPIYLFLG